MKERVKDVLVLAASVCGREDLSAFLARGTGEDAAALAEEAALLLRCYNLTEYELASDYIPLRKSETVHSDGCIAYAALEREPLEIVCVRGERGQRLQFRADEAGIRVRAGEVTVEYNFRPRVKREGDFPECAKGGARLLALGTAAEFALMNGRLEEASLLDRRYRAAGAAACRARGGRLRMRWGG